MGQGAIIGDGEEVKALAMKLKNSLGEIIRLNGEGKNLLSTLAQSTVDKSYDAAESIVNEVASLVNAGLPDCSEAAQKVKAYGEFLISIQDG